MTSTFPTPELLAAVSDADILADPVKSIERGQNPSVVARVASGFVVFGMTQFLPGYCVLLAASEVFELNDLDHADRHQFLADMTMAGDVIAAECAPLRMNYSILGNELPILHAHIQPRYRWEPDEYRSGPAFQYPAEIRARAEHSWRRPEHLDLMRRLAIRFDARAGATTA